MALHWDVIGDDDDRDASSIVGSPNTTKRIANSPNEFFAGNKMRAHPIGEWAAARKHARAKQASLYNKLLGCRGATPAFSVLGLARL